MKIARSVVAPVSPTSIYDLIKWTSNGNNIHNILLQAPTANTNNVYFGSNDSQPGFIIPGGSAALDEVSLKSTFIHGDGVDIVIIMVI